MDNHQREVTISCPTPLLSPPFLQYAPAISFVIIPTTINTITNTISGTVLNTTFAASDSAKLSVACPKTSNNNTATPYASLSAISGSAMITPWSS